MNIGNIAVVGIDNKHFLRHLKDQGYTPIPVSKVKSILNVDTKFGLMLIGGKETEYIDKPALERVYFMNNSTPLAILANDPESITKKMQEVLRDGNIDILYESEIENGIIYQRIDRLFITAQLNYNLNLIQQNLRREETLEKEISFRDRILNHEREVNANIIASITSGLIVFDNRGSVIVANKQAQHILKNSDTDIIGSLYSSVLPQELCYIIDKLIKNEGAHDLCPVIKKYKYLNSFYDIYCYRMLDYHRQPNGVLMLINDITEQENINVLLYRSEKLATVGTMLSGIAHELRNPLAIISARVQRSLVKIGNGKEWLKNYLTSIETQTNRCAAIVDSLLNFTRNKAMNSGYHKVSELIYETLTYIEYQNIFDNITIEKNYKNNLMVFGDRSRFVQVFLNLISNATDAIDGSGKLTITSKKVEKFFTLVEINDTGLGIDKKDAENIFDPFFTTKDPGKGTGLGLAIVYKIVQESNGDVWFESKPGNTSFFVKLPSEK